MNVDLSTRAKLAVTEALNAIGAELSDDKKHAVATIIEHAMADAVRTVTLEIRGAVDTCLGPEEDRAHQLRDEINRCHTALIANLSSLR